MNRRSPQLERRRFLKWVSAAGAFFAAHDCIGAEEPKSGSLPSRGGEDEPRLRHLELVSSVPLAQMGEFCHRSLGLQVVEEKADRLTIGAGLTRLTFLSLRRGIISALGQSRIMKVVHSSIVATVMMVRALSVSICVHLWLSSSHSRRPDWVAALLLWVYPCPSAVFGPGFFGGDARQHRWLTLGLQCYRELRIVSAEFL